MEAFGHGTFFSVVFCFSFWEQFGAWSWNWKRLRKWAGVSRGEETVVDAAKLDVMGVDELES